jgi:hypothetical protein
VLVLVLDPEELRSFSVAAIPSIVDRDVAAIPSIVDRDPEHRLGVARSR